MRLFRHSPNYTLKGKMCMTKDGNLVADRSFFYDLPKPDYFDISFINIEKIIVRESGLDIYMKYSNYVFSFLTRDLSKKQMLLRGIEGNAKTWLDYEFQIIPDTQYHTRIRSIFRESHINALYCYYTAYKLTQYGDAVKCQVGLDKDYIYEINNSKISENFKIASIKHFIIYQSDTAPHLCLYLLDDVVVRYILTMENLESLVADLQSLYTRSKNLENTRWNKCYTAQRTKLIHSDIPWTNMEVKGMDRPEDKKAYEKVILEEFGKLNAHNRDDFYLMVEDTLQNCRFDNSNHGNSQPYLIGVSKLLKELSTYNNSVADEVLDLIRNEQGKILDVLFEEEKTEC